MGGKAIVRIACSGARREDLRRAEHAARELLGLPGDWTSPRGWVWHHKDGRTLQLVPAEIHAAAPHTGGFTLHPVPYAPHVWPAADPLPLLDPGPPLNARRLDRVRFPLPDAYREFLLRHNGGRPRVRAFRGPGGSEEALDAFFGVGCADDLESWADVYDGRVPRSLLPIARDAFGNLVCIDRQGAVFFWDHELEEDAAPAAPIADDLAGFLASFFEDTCVESLLPSARGAGA